MNKQKETVLTSFIIEYNDFNKVQIIHPFLNFIPFNIVPIKVYK